MGFINITHFIIKSPRLSVQKEKQFSKETLVRADIPIKALERNGKIPPDYYIGIFVEVRKLTSVSHN